MRIVRPTSKDLHKLFGPSTRNVWCCSPWITSEGVDLLRAGFKRCSVSLLWTLEVWLRIEEDEREVEITDFTGVLKLLQKLNEEAPDLTISLYSAPNLHAKAVRTESGALVGSANLTGAGFGGNVEMVVTLDADEAEACDTFRAELRHKLREVPLDEFARFVRGEKLPKKPRKTQSGETTDWAAFQEKLLEGRHREGIR